MMNIRNRGEAYAYIRRLEGIIAQCGDAGYTGTLHNERTIRCIKQLWSIK